MMGSTTSACSADCTQGYAQKYGEAPVISVMCRLASNQYIAEAVSEPQQHCTLCRQLVSDLVFRQRTKQETLQVELVSPLAGPIHT